MIRYSVKDSTGATQMFFADGHEIEQCGERLDILLHSGGTHFARVNGFISYLMQITEEADEE